MGDNMRIREISWFHLKRDMMQQSGSEDSGDNHPDLSGLDFLHKQALPSWPLVVSPDLTSYTFPSLFTYFRQKKQHRLPFGVHHWHCTWGSARTSTRGCPGVSPAPHKEWKV